MLLTRRALAAKAGAGLILAGCAGGQATQTRAATPSETEGPFYPADTNIERDADLTRLAGHEARALGQVIQVRCRVLDRTGAAIPGTRVDLWQANAAGRYAHPGDVSEAPLDANFQGFAQLETGPDGAFSITTVKPGAYDSPIGRRTPHLHWRIVSGDATLTTQMYFPGEAQNEEDALFRGQADPRPLIARAGPAPEGMLGFDWEIVLG